MKFTAEIVLVAAIGLGCSTAHEASPAPSDASVISDASHVAVVTDASFDSSAVVVDPCRSSIEWIDRDSEPALRRWIGTGTSFSIAATHTGFLVASVVDDFDAHSYIAHFDRLPRAGSVVAATGGFVPAVPSGLPLPRVFALVDPSGRGLAAALVDGILTWSSGDPNFDTAQGSLPLDGLVGAIALENDAFVVETHDAARREGRHVHSRVQRHPLDGGAPASVYDYDETLGSDYWAQGLESTSEGPWFTFLNDLDFPPTVQAVGPRTHGWVPNNCHVQSYDAVPLSADRIAIAQDCDEQIAIEVRSAGPVVRTQLASGAHDVASHIASDGSTFAVVYRSVDGFAHVAMLTEALDPIADDVVPESGSEEWPAGELDIAALDDGTFAVVTSRTYPDQGDISVRRFRLCR